MNFRKQREGIFATKPVRRRQALSALGALGSLIFLGCGSESDDSNGAKPNQSSRPTSCHDIPDETAGPFPDVKGMITDSQYYRSDISEGKPGIALTLELTVLLSSADCSPIASANVEVWHCDADGVYSEYSSRENPGSTSTTYLRGVQTTDENGRATFKTIYPGWYAPRATHVHVRIYNDATLVKTTQFGLPDATNQAVYGMTSLYKKGQNSTPNDSDQVFGNGALQGTDGGGHLYQIATVTGDNTSGYIAKITVAISDFTGQS